MGLLKAMWGYQKAKLWLLGTMIVLGIILLIQKLSSESFTDTTLYAQTYDNGVQPYYLSKDAVDQMMHPAYDLCIPRVKAECSNDMSSGCFQKALADCIEANADTIRHTCMSKLETGMCSMSCQDDPYSIDCMACKGYGQVHVCRTPSIGPNTQGYMPY